MYNFRVDREGAQEQEYGHTQRTTVGLRGKPTTTDLRANMTDLKVATSNNGGRGTTSTQDLNGVSGETSVVNLFRLIPRPDLAVDTSGDTGDPWCYFVPGRHQRNESTGAK